MKYHLAIIITNDEETEQQSVQYLMATADETIIELVGSRAKKFAEDLGAAKTVFFKHVSDGPTRRGKGIPRAVRVVALDRTHPDFPSGGSDTVSVGDTFRTATEACGMLDRGPNHIAICMRSKAFLLPEERKVTVRGVTLMYEDDYRQVMAACSND